MTKHPGSTARRSSADRIEREHPCLLAVVLALATVASWQARGAGLVPDGATATTVSSTPAGKAVIAIAPPLAGVSHNTYSSFNVGRAGADFQNSGVGARYIVNEVTSTRPSLIEGPIAVVGPRASVVLANPNGITLNGASFVNTGNVAITTGRVRFHDLNPTPGIVQRNVVLTTDQGAIEIGPEGLAGAFANLELIAKRLKIGGPVINTFTSVDARVRAVLGDSRAEVDTSISPADNLTPWIGYSAPATANAGAMLLDITPLGSLTSGRIEIAVTDRGAGVTHAGSLFANVGDFTLAADGELRVIGGSIRSSGRLIAAVSRVDSDSGTFNSGLGTELRAPAIRLCRGSVVAGSAAAMGDIILGQPGASASGATEIDGVAMAASGGIGVFSSGQDVSVRGASIAAGQNVLIQAAGFLQRNEAATASRIVAAQGGVLIEASADLRNSGSLIQGARRIEDNGSSAGAVTLVAGGSFINDTPAGGPLAVVFGRDDDVAIHGLAGVRNRSGRILANGDVRIASPADFYNGVERVGTVGDGARQEVRSSRRNWLGLSKRTQGFTIDYGRLAGPDEQAVIAAGGNVDIAAGSIVNHGGEIDANGGDIRMAAQGAIANEGMVTGQVRFERTCRLLFCRTTADSNTTAVGGLLSASGDIDLRAGSEILNVGGRMLALHDIDLTAPRVVTRGVTVYASLARSQGMKAWFGDTWAQIYAADQGGALTANLGRLRIDGTLFNEGGELSATGGVEASGGVITVRAPRREAVRIEDHLGLTSWLWR